MARPDNLGEGEQQIMEFQWEHGPATDESVPAGVARDRPLTDSTRRTVSRRLEAKQHARHKRDGRHFLYSRAREPHRQAADAARYLLKNSGRSPLVEPERRHLAE